MALWIRPQLELYQRYLHFLAEVQKDGAKDKGNNRSEEDSSCSV
jgi:hypothetical protein